MNKRSHFQSFGYWVKEPSIQNPQLALDGLNELAMQGYDLVRVFLRGTNFTWRSPEYIALIAKMTDEAHRLGLKIAIDCEPHSQIAGREMGKQFPDLMGTRLVRAVMPLHHGQFLGRLKVNTLCSAPPMPTLEAAFVRRDGSVTRLPDLTFKVNYEMEYFDTGFSERYVEYTPSRVPVTSQHYYQVNGQLPDSANGELIAYFTFEDYSLIDFWSEATQRYYDSIVECYKDIPLDGIGWDEPGAQMGWDCYRWGRGSADAYARINGYDLRDRMWLLDETDLTPEAVQVKLDYYRTLSEGLYVAQKRLCDHARAKCGPEAILGTHHTWVGEGGIGDYRAGAVDYFRLNDNMDAGYTDGVWWFDGCMDYVHALGSSLGRMTPSGAAEVNTWHWKPTFAATEHAVRYMALMRINWFNIWFGDASDTSKYPEHYTYEACNVGMRQIRDVLKELDTFRPVVDIAIWHGWEGVMAVNTQAWTFGLKNFQLFGSEALAKRNIPFDFVDSRLLEDATIEEGKLVTRLESYRVLVMPYAMVLPEAVWTKCKDFAQAGGTVIFIGPPPNATMAGRAISDEFAALAGMKALPFKAFDAYVKSRHTLTLNGPHRWDIHVPVESVGGRLILNQEREPHGCAGLHGRFICMTSLVPREEFSDLLASIVSPSVVCHSDSIMWRLYRQADGTQKLILAARKHRPAMQGIIRFAGYEIEISGGMLAIATASADGKVTISGDQLVYELR